MGHSDWYHQMHENDMDFLEKNSDPNSCIGSFRFLNNPLKLDQLCWIKSCFENFKLLESLIHAQSSYLLSRTCFSPEDLTA